MDVIGMIRQWLIAHGYSGLCWDDCGCALDDLCPCGEPRGDCLAGYANAEGFVFQSAAQLRACQVGSGEDVFE